MKKFKEILPGIIILLILLAIAGVLLYYFGLGIAAAARWILTLVQQISTLDTVLVIALISGSITILGLIVNSIVTIRLKTAEHKNKTKEEMRLKMEVPYENFVNMIFDLLLNAKGTKKMTEAELLSRMNNFSKQVTLHGSNKVIKKWCSYRTSVGKLSPTENLKQLEGILFAIRADLGLKRRGMKTGAILSLFINDVQEALKKK